MTKVVSPDTRDGEVHSLFLTVSTPTNSVETCMRKVQAALDNGVSLNVRYEGTTLLHLSVARGDISFTEFLLRKGARIQADDFGRVPSLLAIQLQASDRMCYLLVDAEEGLFTES